MTDPTNQRLRICLNGIVQGVGFRPFVYRLAVDHDLAGFVGNNAEGVFIEVEGPSVRLEQFRTLLTATAPPLARLDSCVVAAIAPRGESGFTIDLSSHSGAATTLISPDVALCDDCRNELFDRADRRYRYPFINCTNCGPRFTIVESIPYDRPNTSMRTFPMCADCRREYDDPRDRRFHAQPVACPVCGPSLVFYDGADQIHTDDVIGSAITELVNGRIVALRGLGGFHLAVDATNEEAVARLRQRKHRFEKPLALMAPDLVAIRRYCDVSVEEERVLSGPAHPIVLLRRKTDPGGLAPSVVYDNRYFGFMLPYTPLHHLLFDGRLDALVMTSGNRAEEPIAIGNDEALERLAPIADCFILHDREILQRCDDSIVRIAAGETRMIRRARGFVPAPVYLGRPTHHKVLAVGAELKNTVALTRGETVFLSQHIGDLDNPMALDFFEHAMAHLQRILEIEPDLVACDLHPGYLSTEWAKARNRLPVVEIQHHHAHLVSVMAENRVEEPTIGIILDGTGYGIDGTIWGGEVLIGDARQFERFAWLEPIPLPGGTAAIREPWRMALSYLDYAFDNRADIPDLPFMTRLPAHGRETVERMIARGVNSPLTSSCGRLFDGVAALLNLCTVNTYEAQAAIALETAAAGCASTLPIGSDRQPAIATGGPLEFGRLIRGVIEKAGRKQPAAEIAARFHHDLAELFVQAAVAARTVTGISRVGLSGGVWQNVLFFEYVTARLQQEGFVVLTHREVPTNDGGIALGQAVIADAVARDVINPAR